MAKVTIIVETEGSKQVVERYTPLGAVHIGGAADRQAARLLLAAFAVAAQPFRAQIADETELFRQAMAAFGFDLSAAVKAACEGDTDD